jgi:hypothetical protein
VDVGIFVEQRCSVVVHGCATYPSHSETTPFYFRLTSARPVTNREARVAEPFVTSP